MRLIRRAIFMTRRTVCILTRQNSRAMPSLRVSTLKTCELVRAWSFPTRNATHRILQFGSGFVKARTMRCSGNIVAGWVILVGIWNAPRLFMKSLVSRLIFTVAVLIIFQFTIRMKSRRAKRRLARRCAMFGCTVTSLRARGRRSPSRLATCTI